MKVVSPMPAFDIARISRDIQTLSSDAYEGRGPATRAEAKTIDYLIREMKAAGLQPAGENGDWCQSVPLLKSDIVGSPTIMLDIGDGPQTLTQGDQIALRAALTGQDEVTIHGLPLIFVGYGVTAPERNWDDFKGADLRGKIMIVLVNDPGFEGGNSEFADGRMTYYGRWTYKCEEAARRGAAGVLIIHETEAASYGWETVKNSNIITTFDVMRRDPSAWHAPLEGWIQRDLAAQIFGASGLDFEVAKSSARKNDFRPIPLEATLSAGYTNKLELATSHNVLGVLTGAKYPRETVIYMAHWDHLGIGEPDASGDRIYHGAIDNASGIAALLELARANAAAGSPDRSILFLATAAEEKGLLGSEYYAANPLWPLALTVGVINMDPPFAAGKTRDFSIVGFAELDLLTMLTAIAATQGRRYTPDAQPEAGYFFRTDHFPFAKRGVPAITFEPGQDLVNGGATHGKKLADAYYRDKYHQPADKFDPDWNTDGVVDDMMLFYSLGRQLAGDRVWPTWSPNSEFRAIRDESASERL